VENDGIRERSFGGGHRCCWNSPTDIPEDEDIAEDEDITEDEGANEDEEDEEAEEDILLAKADAVEWTMLPMVDISAPPPSKTPPSNTPPS
jgi:hypothetical protein